VGKQRVYIEEKERERKKGESGKDIQQQQFCKQTTSIKCNSANVIFILQHSHQKSLIVPDR
jgi:hypothetical protein